MARRKIGKPRFYADTLQYLKAIGYYDGSDTPELFTLDPTNSNIYSTGDFSFNINKQDNAISLLLSSIPSSDVSGVYAGVLGHDMTSDSSFGFKLSDGESVQEITATEIVNCLNGNSSEYGGYSLMQVNDISFSENTNEVIFSVDGADIKLGAITFGRWFEPEYSFDLQATMTNDYEGIKTKTTIGGYTLSNINHLGQPNWGNGLPAWSLGINEIDYNVGGAKGRRSWEVGLSYLTDDKIFSKAGNSDKFFTYDTDENTYTFDTSLSSFMRMSLNGKLPFIFCPDSSATDLEFALCRITNKPSFKQVANNLFSTSLVITETY